MYESPKSSRQRLRAGAPARPTPSPVPLRLVTHVLVFRILLSNDATVARRSDDVCAERMTPATAGDLRCLIRKSCSSRELRLALDKRQLDSFLNTATRSLERAGMHPPPPNPPRRRRRCTHGSRSSSVILGEDGSAAPCSSASTLRHRFFAEPIRTQTFAAAPTKLADRAR